MKCRGAVLRGVGMDWQIEEITLDPPREGEVLVKMGVAGICHTDDHFTTGDMVPTPDLVAMYEAVGVPTPDYFPMLGGHEGAGIVEAVGAGVRSVQPGDHVGLSFIAACGTCRWCVSGRTYLCDNGAMMMAKEMVTDNTVRHHVGDEFVASSLVLAQMGQLEGPMLEPSITRYDPSANFRSNRITWGWVPWEEPIAVIDGAFTPKTVEKPTAAAPPAAPK